jgi:hypothetical protein
MVAVEGRDASRPDVIRQAGATLLHETCSEAKRLDRDRTHWWQVSVESHRPSVESPPYPMPRRRASALGTAGAEGWSTTPPFSTLTQASGYTASATPSASRKVVLICRT